MKKKEKKLERQRVRAEMKDVKKPVKQKQVCEKKGVPKIKKTNKREKSKRTNNLKLSSRENDAACLYCQGLYSESRED